MKLSVSVTNYSWRVPISGSADAPAARKRQNHLMAMACLCRPTRDQLAGLVHTVPDW
jgi:hypothetical protein